MRYTIRGGEAGSLALAENNTLKSIIQNLFLILGTRRGTVPMYRDFGMPQNFLDRPTAAAEAIMTSEIFEAVAQFEPRCEVLDVRFEYDGTGKVTTILEVNINE